MSAVVGLAAWIPPAGGTTAGPTARLAAVQAVSVPWGTVGYRSVGSGPPLVLLIGGGGPAVSIDDWPPALLDDLARDHRVVTMDYEGIGLTTRRPGLITITRLADDTADFITALGLGQPDVLGWSMGGFVAQSLAVRHPGSVRRLVLCASALGDGTATTAVVSGSQRYPGQWIFPLDGQNRSRADAYERSVRSFPHYYEGPPDVAAEEGLANSIWFNGAVPEGHEVGTLQLPVLVGDGGHDVLTPPPDSAQLARSLHAQLVVYGDAGHGFLVQHPADWARQVSRFLAAPCATPSPGPCS